MKLFQMLSTLDILISLTISIGLIIAFLRSNKVSIATNSLMLGRTLSLPMFIATLVSSWYGGIFAVTEISFKHGVYNFITQGIFWYFSAFCFALFIVKRACKHQVFSLIEIIEKNYDRKTARMFAILLFAKTLPITYAISIGLFINCLFNLPLELGIFIGSIVVMFYCLNGGFKRILQIDIAQFLLMFLAVISVIYFSWTKFGGLEYLQNALPSHYFSAKGNHNFSTMLLWLIIAVSTTFLSPIFYHRCFIAKDYRTARKGILISMLFWFICDIGTTMGGMYAKAHLPEVDSGIAYALYALEILPDGLKGLFLIAILITVFSALGTHLYAASTIISYDLAPLGMKNSKNFYFYSIIFTTILTIFLSFQFNGDLEKAWIFSESIFLASAFIPLIIALYFKNKPHSSSVLKALYITTICTITWEISYFNHYLESFFIGIIVNCSCFIFIYSKQYFKFI